MDNIVESVLLERICGIAEIQPVIMSKKRIIEEVEAVANAWPWQVSLQKNSE